MEQVRKDPLVLELTDVVNDKLHGHNLVLVQSDINRRDLLHLTSTPVLLLPTVKDGELFVKVSGIVLMKHALHSLVVEGHIADKRLRF